MRCLPDHPKHEVLRDIVKLTMDWNDKEAGPERMLTIFENTKKSKEIEKKLFGAHHDIALF